MNKENKNFSLQDQPVGFSSVIKNLTGEDTLVTRLMELGFVRGEKIKICGKAPFGDPYMVEVRGSVIALRKEELICIQII